MQNNNKQNRLDGKVAIITGAARGQGAAEARLFVREGAKVILSDIREEEGRAVAAELDEAAIFVHHDVADKQGWQDIVNLALTRFGRIDILINNAGIYQPQTLRETTNELWEATYRTNQLGPFLGMKAVVAPMCEAGSGSIVNISSVGGIRGRAGLFAYTATKWALRGMTKSAAAELASLGIRVNAILPGIIDTPMISVNSPELMQQILADTPMGHLGKPEEVANAALFLASDESSFVTGADITVDGGSSL